MNQLIVIISEEEFETAPTLLKYMASFVILKNKEGKFFVYKDRCNIVPRKTILNGSELLSYIRTIQTKNIEPDYEF